MSLGSELICHNIPLALHFKGETIFPFLSHYFEAVYYSEDHFLGNGRQTRPDYKKIVRSQAFKSDADNWVVFPPIPWGPHESIDPEEIDADQNIHGKFIPAPAQATVYVDGAGLVTRSMGLLSFFGEEDRNFKGKPIREHLLLSEGIQSALSTRFENQPSPELSEELEDGTRVSLRAHRPRSSAPRSVRLRVSRPQAASKTKTAVFDQKGQLTGASAAHSFLEACAAEDFAKLQAAVLEAKDQQVSPFSLSIEGTRYRVWLSKAELAFPMGPSPRHWLGVDDTGRDVFARILYGFRTSMTFAMVLVIFSMGLGVIVGAIQGYFGGWIDLLSQRSIEIWESMPFLYVMIFMGAVFGQGFLLLLLCYALFNWIGISYYMRAEFLRLRRLPFVEAAQALGIPTWRIILRHILPNALVPVITFFPFSLVSAIGSLTALDYLGFGLPIPTPSWGELLKQAQNDPSAWWLILYPFLALFTVILLGVFMGEGARAAFDPKRESRLR